jgi:t-SNARE complex subunit (syntaxin)
MDRLNDFQRASEAAQLNLKAHDYNKKEHGALPKGGNPLFQPFQSDNVQKTVILSDAVSVEIPPVISAEDEQMEMPRFFGQINEVKESNKRVLVFMDELEKLHREALSTADSEASEAISGKIEVLMGKLNQMTNRTRRTLQEMDQVTKELVANSSNNNASSSGNLRMRQSNHRQLSKAFLDVMKRYQKTQEHYQEKYRTQLQRQYLIVKPRATKSELAELTRDPEAMKVQVFAMSVKADSKKTLGQMKNRLQDMQNIERSILELNQMFLQMQDLIVSQGEIINRVEYNVDQIQDYTAQASKNMENALESQKAIQKKKWYIVMIVMVIIGVILACVVISVLINMLPTLLTLKLLGA